MTQTGPLQTLIDDVDKGCPRRETSLSDILHHFGDRSFGPVITLCGLFMISPIAALPGAPLIISVVMLSFSLQIVLGRRTPWIPDFFSKVRVKKRDVRKTRRILSPWISSVDDIVRPRLHWAANKKFRILAAVFSSVLALTVIPLGPVPFGVALPGILTLMLGLGILARDGLMIILSYLGFGIFVLLVMFLIL